MKDDNLQTIYMALREHVLALRDERTGVWTGELSSSALGTALALTALGDGGESDDRRLAESGVAWLAAHVNADGGWGDTPGSASNLSTTLLAHAALVAMETRGRESTVASRETLVGSTLVQAERWIAGQVGPATTPEAVARALADVYGNDRTFAVPILAFLAICGEDASAWPSVPPLPFLLALLPQRLYRFFRLQVVSYALPALIAVGLCRHICVARARGRVAWGRWFASSLLLRLAALQPSHGGFLDAIPLTAFVCLTLRHAGYGEHSVVQKGLAFLRQAARRDGSWAIDSNLRTWVTSLAACAVWRLRVGNEACADACPQMDVRTWRLESGGLADAERVAGWLVSAQLKAKHPFTGAAPGGWAWTDLPGGVPDADDTAAALLALRRLKDVGCRKDVSGAVRGGVRWLLGLQNADGGVPTFCRGWGRLPFDRSCPDISAHALAALMAWADVSPLIDKAMSRLVRYLDQSQQPDGSWVPLWFGHQESPGGRNPLVGTARVVDALRRCQETESPLALDVSASLSRGEAWLLSEQHADGGWGMGRGATVEETALAVIALTGGMGACSKAVERGCCWLATNWQTGADRPTPIGLYFSVLWYHEKLYPLVWTLEALGRKVASL